MKNFISYVIVVFKHTEIINGEIWKLYEIYEMKCGNSTYIIGSVKYSIKEIKWRDELYLGPSRLMLKI